MNPLTHHLNNLPIDLVNALQTEFQKLHQQYFLGCWEPSQLDGGRFAEAVLRIVEFKDIGSYTAIGKQINRLKIVQSVEKNTALADSLRFHIPHLAGFILDFRNNRNVGHLGTIDVNEMDSTFVLHTANWLVAELIRLETQMDPDEAQTEIKKIIERKVPIIEEIGGRLKCLHPKLGAKAKTMVFCYQKYPNEVSLDDLTDWMEYSNKGVLRKQLLELNKDGRLDFRNDVARLTKKVFCGSKRMFLLSLKYDLANKPRRKADGFLRGRKIRRMNLWKEKENLRKESGWKRGDLNISALRMILRCPSGWIALGAGCLANRMNAKFAEK